MEAETVMKLFDSFWFEEKMFKKEIHQTAFQTNPDIEIQNPEKLNFSRSRSILSRSISDDLTSQVMFMSGSASPHSVLLHLPQPKTVPTGKEMKEEVSGSAEDHGSVLKLGKKNKRALSKSLSELEYEEVKGFMDLGFVFSDEDKESDLASIIPGLHNLGKKEKIDKVVELYDATRRPYLSESWVYLDRRKEKPLMKWNFPALSNETDMKKNLKTWAHTVASAVR